ncbi:hypothetical protein M0813_24537 [Anaeramoeba flamelloides]|uniref:Uncharacterized protein n=1 Tax=Anaeramoeba flamelloides TaxID=1746091 RepID=A0ABQ8Y8X6_9EUKA|nr:hypothetical protein M0813_24537 [Anaeramoeba flamelloides]
MKQRTKHTFVPWIGRSEWLKVYQGFYQEKDESKLEEIFSIISCWDSRRGTPHYVSTTSLIHKCLAQEKTNGDLQRLELSMALTRFINGVVDSYQTGSKVIPIRKLAKRLQIPSYLVQIRHDATHGKLPSLDFLKISSDYCMEWLQKRYWAPIAAKMAKDPIKAIEKILDGYFKSNLTLLQYQNSKNNENSNSSVPKKRNNKGEYKNKNQIANVVKKIESAAGISKISDLVSKALLKPGLILWNKTPNIKKTNDQQQIDQQLQIWYFLIEEFAFRWKPFTEKFILQCGEQLRNLVQKSVLLNSRKKSKRERTTLLLLIITLIDTISTTPKKIKKGLSKEQRSRIQVSKSFNRTRVNSLFNKLLYIVNNALEQNEIDKLVQVFFQFKSLNQIQKKNLLNLLKTQNQKSVTKKNQIKEIDQYDLKFFEKFLNINQNPNVNNGMQIENNNLNIDLEKNNDDEDDENIGVLKMNNNWKICHDWDHFCPIGCLPGDVIPNLEIDYQYQPIECSKDEVDLMFPNTENNLIGFEENDMQLDIIDEQQIENNFPINQFSEKIIFL